MAGVLIKTLSLLMVLCLAGTVLIRLLVVRPAAGDGQAPPGRAARLVREANLQAHVLMICLEMIGYFSDQPGSQHFPFPLLRLFYPSTGNYIVVVDRMRSGHGPRIRDAMRPAAAPLPVYSINAPAFLWGIGLSDHRNFWKSGFDAVMITDTAFYRNRAYHTAGDTADRLDFTRMARVVDGLFLCMPVQTSASPLLANRDR